MRLRQFTYGGQTFLVPLLRPCEKVGRRWLKRVAQAIQSDGCSGVPDFHLDCCVVHDLAYKFAINPWGRPVTRAEADAAFRVCIQAHSKLGRFSPMSWWRWAGVRVGGWKAWEAHRAAQQVRSGGRAPGPEQMPPEAS